MNKKIFYFYFYILYFIFIFIFFTFITFVGSNNAEFGDSIVDENASITEYWYEEYQL